MFIFNCLSLVFVTALSSIWRGFVLTKLWVWFIVPVFHVPLLTIALAIGLSLVIGFLTHQYMRNTDDRPMSDQVIESFIHALMYPTMALLIGWVVTLFL